MILPDILKEVASQGDLEEEREDEEAEADEQDTGQPETIVTPGETSVVENPREAGLSDSHLERPLQTIPRWTKPLWNSSIAKGPPFCDK